MAFPRLVIEVLPHMSGTAGGRIKSMNARSILLLTTLTTLASSSPGSAQFFLFQNPFFRTLLVNGDRGRRVEQKRDRARQVEV